MNLKGVKGRAFWTMGVIVAFGITYLLCRFTFFEIHQMKHWTNILAIVGSIVLIFSTIFDFKKLSLLTVVGYIGGFAIAMLFNTDSLSQSGTIKNNAWLLWCVAFIVIILIGLIWEIFSRRRKK